MGEDVGDLPENLAYAERRLREIAPRFATDEDQTSQRLTVLEIALGRVADGWRSALHRQREVEHLTRLLQQTKQLEHDPFRHENEQDRERAARQRDAAHRELQTINDEAIKTLGLWKQQLDARDRGERPPPKWQRTGPAIFHP